MERYPIRQDLLHVIFEAIICVLMIHDCPMIKIPFENETKEKQSYPRTIVARAQMQTYQIS